MLLVVLVLYFSDARTITKLEWVNAMNYEPFSFGIDTVNTIHWLLDLIKKIVLSTYSVKENNCRSSKSF